MAPRNKAVAKGLDLSETLDADQFPAPNTRRSPWSDLLDELWEGTLAGVIPLSEDNLPKFVQLGSFKNANGARTQIRALSKKGYDVDYEFKSVTSKEGSALWGRALI
jgi:hypothetical protein